MAVLKDLIVYGNSRFLNGSKFNTINAESIGAEQGIFNKLIATTLDAKEATVDNLTAQNATVVGLLDVQGELHTNAWTNANIANIGGSFYISPTVEPTDGTTTISITRNSATSWTVSASGTFATDFIKSGTATSGVAWPKNSLVLITGDVVIGDMIYPLGTLKGTLNAQVTATAASTSKTITITGVTDAQNNNAPSVLQELYELNNNANISNATFKKGKISLYKLGSNPIGILMTSMGTDSNSLIDIYGGVSTNPNVRIGHLGALSSYTDSADNIRQPSGWGIYTDNGFFKGVIVADSGSIGHFTIDANAIYSGSHSAYNSNNAGIFIGRPNSDSSDYYIAGGPRDGSTTNPLWYLKSDGSAKIGAMTLSSAGVLAVPAANISGTLTASQVDVSGIITAGSIVTNTLTGGTFNTTDYIRVSTQASSSLTIGTSGAKTDWRIIAGKTFGVDKAGNLYATSANITGTITATSGTIGGYSLTANYLQATDGTTGLSVADNSTTASWAFWAGGNTSSAANFRVDHSGNLYAKSATISGTSTIADTVTIGGKEQSEYLNSNIQIGGKNLILNSEHVNIAISPYINSNSRTYAATVDGEQVYYCSGSKYIRVDFPTLIIGEEYTFSWDVARQSGGTTVDAYITIGGETGKKVGQAIASTWNRYFTTFVATANSTYALIQVYDLSNDSYVGAARHCKLEKGNKATDWTPAPEDIDVHKYVTDIDSNNGITIKPLTSTGNDYLQMDSTSIDFYRGIGTNSAAVSVMSLSDSVFRMGKSNAQRVEITASAVDMYDKNNKLTTRVNENGLTIYKAGTQVASYGTDATIGQVAANLYNVFIDADSGIALRKNTTSLLNINSNQIDINNSSGNVMTRVNSSGLTVFDGSGTADTNKLAIFGSSIQLGAVDANKYNILISPTGSISIRQNTNIINFIDSYGMKIYLPGDQSYPVADFGSTTTIGKSINSHVNIESTGVDIYQGLGIEYKIASFGESTIIGKENGSHLTLSSNGFSVYDNAPVEVLSIKPAGEVITRQVIKDYYEESIGSYSTAKSISKVLTESFTSITNVALKFTSPYGPTTTHNFTLGTPIGVIVYTNSSHSSSTTVNFTVTYNASTQTLTITSGSNSPQSIDVHLQTIQGSLNVDSPALYIGAEDTSLVKVDYHSLQMIDKEGDSFFEVKDLRDANGRAQVSETFNILENESSPGSPDIDTYYVLKGAVAATSDVTSVKINGVSVSNWQASIQSTSMRIKFTSSTGISVGDLVTVIYYSSGQKQKALTFGTRSYPSYINVPGQMSIAMGENVIAEGMYSFATGLETEAYGVSAHVEGKYSKALGSASHAEGEQTTASGSFSHAEGSGTQATGVRSHAEGLVCIASEDSAHAEGSSTTASQISAHAEGDHTTASGPMSHAEGYHTIASNSGAHTEGSNTIASEAYAHAEGEYTRAQARNAHSQNCYTVATEDNQTVIGKYNKVTRNGSGTTNDPYVYTNAGNYAFIIGNGTGDETANRSNALTVDWNGGITISNHSSPIGSQVNGTKVDTSSTAIPDSINVTTGNGTSIAQLILPAGTWIVYGQARFASNSTGYRRMGLSTTKNNASLDITFGASSSGATQISNTRVLSPSSQTTYYLNVTHNGGTTLAVSDIVFSAWRLV